jgi:2',3'-cyclic-nucleotide 2'-phosphodiesterase (5'-nucleotidase family)
VTHSATRAAVLALGGMLGVFAAGGCAPGAPPPAPLNPVRLLLLGDIPSGDTLGLPRVATVRNRIAAQGPVLFVAAGNVLAFGSGPSARRSIAALNAARLDYATFGAEELALAADTLARRIAASKFKWLSSNCAFATAPADTAVRRRLLAWDTVRISTHKVGIFGISRPAPGDSATGGGSALRCSDPNGAALRIVDTLVAQGADLIVALTHQPTADDRDLLLRESRLDLVLGGSEREPRNATVADRHVLKSGAGARAAQFVTLWGGKEKWRQAVGLVPIDSRLPADTAVARAVTQIPAE